MSETPPGAGQADSINEEIAAGDPLADKKKSRRPASKFTARRYLMLHLGLPKLPAQ